MFESHGGARHRPFNSPLLSSRETKLSLVGGDRRERELLERKEGAHDSGVVGRGDERVVLGEVSASRGFGSSSSMTGWVCEHGHGDIDQRRRNKMNVDGRLERTRSRNKGCEGDFNDKDEGGVNLTAEAYAAVDRKNNITGDTRMGLVGDVKCRQPIDMYERRGKPLDRQWRRQCRRRRSVLLEGGQHSEDNRHRRRRSLDTLDSCSAAAVADACRASGRQSEGKGFVGKEDPLREGGRRLEKRGRSDRVDGYGDLLERRPPSISTPSRNQTDQERSCSRCCSCRKHSGCRGSVGAGADAAGEKHHRCGAFRLPEPRILIPRQRRPLNVAPGKNIVRESPDNFRAGGVRRVEERNWGRPKCSMMDKNKDKVANSGVGTGIWRGRDGSEMNVPLRKEEAKRAARRGLDEHKHPLVENNASGSVGDICPQPPRRPRQRSLEANRHRALRRSDGRESGNDGTGDIPTVTRPKPPQVAASREPVVSTLHPRRLVNVAVRMLHDLLLLLSFFLLTTYIYVCVYTLETIFPSVLAVFVSLLFGAFLTVLPHTYTL